ncbi:hypothetical protein ABZV91_30490 [Nocardia sp. NPDC004568]|uniref:hypothetical protein n=1 Tax=Nocardia sp. NPDC004568 TaxID=3154551 RepID=UPI0033A52BFD
MTAGHTAARAMQAGADRLVDLLTRRASPVLTGNHNGNAVRHGIDSLVEAQRASKHPFDEHSTAGDAVPARRVAPLARGTVFRGTDYETGQPFDFTSDEIVSYPILDPDRKPVGVHYPTTSEDVEEPIVWTRDGLALTREFCYVADKDAPLDRALLGWMKADWAGGPPEQGLVFRMAHGLTDGSGYAIKLRKTPGADVVKPAMVAVNGATYGEINLADDYYRQVLSRFATGKDIDVACWTGSGPAGQDSAAVLHAAGVPFDVHTSAAEVAHVPPSNDRPNMLNGVGVFVEVNREKGMDVFREVNRETGMGFFLEVNSEKGMVRSPWSTHPAPREPASSD